MQATRRLRAYGRVQGVGYREALRREAQARGIAGWVRNRLDGSVEALMRGEAAALEALAAWARRGPPAARVDRVELQEAEGEAIPAGFERLPTA
jgi:acylphosphatase